MHCPDNGREGRTSWHLNGRSCERVTREGQEKDRSRWQLEAVFMPRSERWQGMLGEVFEVAEQCARPVSAITVELEGGRE